MFLKVNVTTELQTLLPNGGFVPAWPVQVAWEGLRVARKIRVDAFVGDSLAAAQDSR